MVKKILHNATLFFMLAITSCCTIINGSTQQLSVSSTPTAAKVTIDGQDLGYTPFIATLKRKNNHTVKVELEGYLPYEISLSRKVDGWLAGNIVFGGLIGIAIDALTGSMYKLSPGQLDAQLTKSSANITNTKNGLYCAIVLKPGGNWQKIGQLAKAAN